MKTPDNHSYRLKMNLMIQNLLLSALSTTKFVMQHRSHPLSQSAEHFQLVDKEHIDQFILQVKNTTPGRTLTMTLDDQILVYTAMDLTCKTYLTDLGDRLAAMNLEALENTKASFNEIRSTVLKGCEFVMEGMRENLTGIEAFDDRREILEQFVRV